MRQQNYLPSRPQWDTEPNSTQPNAVHHTRRKRDSGCALPLLPSPHGHGRRQQPPHATASMHYKRSIHIHCNVHIVCVCVPAETQSKEVEKREQSMWRDAQKCTAGTHGGDNKKKTAQTHDCTAAQAAAIHKRFI
ncbi:hypothetical protein TcCL_Unassigned03538 [Trypanosoma cruzi]|nr:hypothetical protein TcCL_Unassigned03538 [Trypanosoma cruzi]